MSRELRINYDASKTVTAKVVSAADGTSTTVSLAESPAGYYVANFPAVAAGTYDIAYIESGYIIGGETINWTGTAATTLSTVKTELDTVLGDIVGIQATLAAGVSVDMSEVQDQLDAIQNKVNSIGSGNVTVVGPVLSNELIEVVQGSDYTQTAGNSISFGFDGAPDLTGAIVQLKAAASNQSGCLYSPKMATFSITRIDSGAAAATF